ncbi:hypothetical protein scyTo_0007622 [Scyliorhinus torazame]|uniref:Uncharacterized protein n=1 Tax=Scyliorhinus torazame TaxID=75743 RepID=A0A401NVW2_SCYTO|nr:hypothetical protein [Scyliorhinus torazame]
MKKDCVSASFQKKARPSSIPRAVSFLHFTSLTKRSLTKRQFRSDGELASVSTQQDSDIDNWTYTPLQRNAAQVDVLLGGDAVRRDEAYTCTHHSKSLRLIANFITQDYQAPLGFEEFSFTEGTEEF